MSAEEFPFVIRSTKKRTARSKPMVRILLPDVAVKEHVKIRYNLPYSEAQFIEHLKEYFDASYIEKEWNVLFDLYVENVWDMHVPLVKKIVRSEIRKMKSIEQAWKDILIRLKVEVNLEFVKWYSNRTKRIFRDVIWEEIRNPVSRLIRARIARDPRAVTTRDILTHVARELNGEYLAIFKSRIKELIPVIWAELQ